MFESYWEVFIERFPFSLLSSFLDILIFGIVLYLCFRFFRMIDTLFAEKCTDIGVVNSLHFKPETKVVGIASPHQPSIGFCVAEWSAMVDFYHEEHCCIISKEVFDVLSERDVVKVVYVIGRFTQNIYVEHIEPR